MPDESGTVISLEELRKRAELRLRRPPEPAESQDHLQALVYELQVHQVELEMQNDELRRAHEEMARARDRYFDVFDLAPVAYLNLDASGKILEANLAAASLLGAQRRRLVGRWLSAFLSVPEADAFHRFRQVVFETGKKQTCKLNLVKEGTPAVPVRVEAVATSDAGERPECRVVLFDLRELDRLQEDVRTRDARIDGLLAATGDAVVTVGPGGSIEALNPAAERLFGRTAAEAQGKSIATVIPALEAEGALAEASAHGQLMGQRADGASLRLDVSVANWLERGWKKHTLVIAERSRRAAGAPRPRSVPLRRAALVVDDDEEILRFVAEYVADLGFDVRSAADGEKALRIAGAWGRSIDLLVSDVEMPGMSGHELARRLLKADPAVRVLLVSGAFDDPPVDAGPMSFLAKPFDVAALRAKLRAMFGDKP